MKTISFTTFVLILFLLLKSTNSIAQDEFYAKPTVIDTEKVQLRNIDENNYSTEQDYNQSTQNNNSENEVVNEPDNNQIDKDKPMRREHRNEHTEEITNFVIDVFVNTMLIIVAFWQ